MEEIRKQVAVARRRMVTQQFLTIVTWSMFAMLLIAAVGLAIPKIWVLKVDAMAWMWSWIGGAAAAGLLIALAWTYIVRRAPMEAAIEIDRRFQLKERVSSALSLTPDEMDSEVGRALVNDAVRRVERIDVRDNFALRLNWRALLPLLPAVAIFALVVFVPDATPKKQAQAATETSAEANRVKKSAQQLKKRLARAEKKDQGKELSDTDLLLKGLQKGLDELSNKANVDRKKALVKLNDMAKHLEERRKKLGGADKMRKQLNRLKNIQAGPADKIADAMKEGNFQKALDELKNLQDKLSKGEMTDEEKKQLAEQLKQLKDKLQEMVNAHKQAKKDIDQEIKKRQAAGDLEGAGRLQRQLDQLNSMNSQMDRMQQMASSLNQCSQCLQSGDSKNAAAEMGELAKSLQDLQNQMDELETLTQVMDEIAACKESMNCGMCDGEGCEGCMGQSWQLSQFGQGKGGMGLGAGRGEGERPEERTNTSFYESQVRGTLQPGEAVRTGSVGGPNRAGRSLEDVKDQISSNLSEDADPLIDVKLPRKERQHAKQYFERFRKGE